MEYGLEEMLTLSIRRVRSWKRKENVCIAVTRLKERERMVENKQSREREKGLKHKQPRQHKR